MDSPNHSEKNVMLRIYIVIVIVLATLIATGWFVLMIRASTVAPPRAVTEAEHQLCDDMPRGSQVMENNRLACFNELYDGERIRLWQ